MCVLCTMNLVIISIKFLTVTARTKDLLQGNLTRGQFYIKRRTKGHGKKKKQPNKQKTHPHSQKENKQTKQTKKEQNQANKKRRYTECPLKMLLGHASCWFVHSEHRLLLTQWGTTKDKRMQHTSPANFNNSECRTRSFLAAGGRWKLPLKQQPRSSVKQG